MYYQHFGLSGPPFSPAFSATPLFLGAGHREALAALEWGLCEPSGFTLLVGEAGTGKTTLILSLLARRREGVRAAWVADPKLSFEEMLQVIAGQLNLRPQQANRFELLKALDTFVAGLKPQQSVALIFDEVQGLSDELLEELRILRNVRSANDRRLQIILVGHLDFVPRLAQPRLAQLNQRIGARALLPILKANEIRDYLEYRLQAHGGSVSKLFRPSAVKQLIRECSGIPRKINLFCDNALIGAYAQGARKVSGRHMTAAIRDYQDLLWTTKRRALLPSIGFLKRIRNARGWSFARLFSVCVIVLLVMAFSYRRNPLVFGSLAPQLQKLLAAIPGSRADRAFPDLTALAQYPGAKVTRPTTSSGTSDEGKPARATAMLQGGNPPASTIELVAQHVPGSGDGIPALPPEVEKPQPRPPAAAEAPKPRVATQGPVASIERPPANVHEPAASAEDFTVVVKRGDSLSKIASDRFGSGTANRIPSLLQANPQITDANRIFPGQIIHVRAPRNEQ